MIKARKKGNLPPFALSECVFFGILNEAKAPLTECGVDASILSRDTGQ